MKYLPDIPYRAPAQPSHSPVEDHNQSLGRLAGIRTMAAVCRRCPGLDTLLDDGRYARTGESFRRLAYCS